jgi:four helix bundle protein
MNEENKSKSIISFIGLNVYQGSYEAMLIIFREKLPYLPENEKFDLYRQLSRSNKATPRLIAVGHAKKHQKAVFQKYIDNAHAEANEILVSIEQYRDLNNTGESKSNNLPDSYDKISRQLYKHSFSWNKFIKRPNRKHIAHYDTSFANDIVNA